MQAPENEPASQMTSEQKALIDKENRWRNLFADDPNNSELQNPHLGLLHVFENMDKFNYEEETSEEKTVPKLLTQYRQLDLSGPAILEKEQFLKKWKEFTQDCFSGLNWNNVFAAGGAVLGCLANSQDGYRGSDIDLFIYGINDERIANQKVREIYDVIVRNTGGKGDVIRTNRALTILCSYPFRHVQIILRLYKSPAEVLLGFDIDSCCVGYDGSDVWCMERFQRAITKRYNLVNVSRRSMTYEQRLFKYSKRGFAVAVPKLDKTRINPDIFNKTVRDVQGLAKLLLYDFNQNNGRSNFVRPSRKMMSSDTEEGSDYNNDLPIPWGPEWQTDAIISLLNTKNKAAFFSSVRRNKKQGEQGDKTPKPYNHLFTSNSQKLASGDFSVWKRSLDGVDVQRPIEWIKDNPAYQDFDNGFRRLMTGSFEPLLAETWDDGVYLLPGQPSSVSSYQGSLSTNTSSIKDNKGSPPRHQGLGLVAQSKFPFDTDESTLPRPGLGFVTKDEPKKNPVRSFPVPFVPPSTGSTFGGVFTGSTDPSVYGGGGFGVTSGFFTGATDVDLSAFGGGTFGGGQSLGVQTATSAFSFTGAPQSMNLLSANQQLKEEREAKKPIPKSAKLTKKKTKDYESEEEEEEEEEFPKPVPKVFLSKRFTKEEEEEEEEEEVFHKGRGKTKISKEDFPKSKKRTVKPIESDVDEEEEEETHKKTSKEEFPVSKSPKRIVKGKVTKEKKERGKIQSFGAPIAPPPPAVTFGAPTVPPPPAFTFGAPPTAQQSYTFGAPPTTQPPFNLDVSTLPFGNMQMLPNLFNQGQVPHSPIQVPPWMKTPEKVDPYRFSFPTASPGIAAPAPAPVSSMGIPPLVSTIGSTSSSQTKLFLLLSLSFKKGLISPDEKGKLKDLVITGNDLVLAALEVFEIDQDLDELVDTFKRICKFVS